METDFGKARRYLREALESADHAPTPQWGVWLAYVDRVADLQADRVPEEIRDRYNMWQETIAGLGRDDSDRALSEVVTEEMSDDQARDMIQTLREMAVEIGAIDA